MVSPVRVGSAPTRAHRLVVISNRTPSDARGRGRQVGGLVSVLAPALRGEAGIWLGWSGQGGDDPEQLAIDREAAPARATFDLPPGVTRAFYDGFCNSVLWPLFHDFPERVRATDGDWAAYVATNERYARHALALAASDAVIWAQDYHLLLVARALRALGHRGRIGMFLHIPFPRPDQLAAVPRGRDLVEAMLAFDLIGFQTAASAARFVAAARALPGTRAHPTAVERGDRVTAVGVFPVPIDPEPFRPATDELVPELAGLVRQLGDRRVIVGVDRLDYSKGIPERLAAFERLLEQSPRWHRRVALVQVAVPSRTAIPAYAEVRREVEAYVGRINGRFGDLDWVPVRYLYRSFEPRALAQLYRLAAVGLVTPLCDGMNLVAKEFVAAQRDDDPGVLVLSQHAGAAESLDAAIITDPRDRDGLAADLHVALAMPRAERVRRQARLTQALARGGTPADWTSAFLAALEPRALRSAG